jgi:hypothetical protein
MFRIETIAEELREESRGLDFATFDGRDAARLTNVGAEIERLGAAIKLGFAKRAADTNGWHHASAATSSEQWLAGVSGCSEFQARDALQTAKRIEKCSATAQRLRDGSLSLAQASLVAKAAEVDPDAESRMLRTAEREGLRTLRDRSDRVVAAAADEIEAHARAKRERHLRTWRVGVATHGSFSGPSEDVDVFLRALKPFEQARFDQGRKRDDDQQRETYDARCFDALIDLARNQRSGGGVDVQTVVSRTRHVPEALKVAIAERDQRCKVRGCDRTHDLERHHTLEFSAHHLTTYELLGMLCGDHHDLVTYRGHDVVVHDDGTWSLRPPDYLDERLPGAA